MELDALPDLPAKIAYAQNKFVELADYRVDSKGRK
jgi:hypothetical protein